MRMRMLVTVDLAHGRDEAVSYLPKEIERLLYEKNYVVSAKAASFGDETLAGEMADEIARLNVLLALKLKDHE